MIVRAAQGCHQRQGPLLEANERHRADAVVLGLRFEYRLRDGAILEVRYCVRELVVVVLKRRQHCDTGARKALAAAFENRGHQQHEHIGERPGRRAALDQSTGADGNVRDPIGVLDLGARSGRFERQTPQGLRYNIRRTLRRTRHAWQL